MKTLIVLLILLMCVPAYGEVRVKAGYSDVLCPAVISNGVIEPSYQYRWDNVALELGAMYQMHKVDDVGYLNTVNPNLTWNT